MPAARKRICVNCSDRKYYLTGNAMSAITQFDKAYPEYHLAAYAARSQNILVPLLAADYHSGMELAAKSGATGIAESCERLSVFEKMPGLYRNLRDLFGVPVSVLRALNKEQVCDAVMARVREIFEYRPVFLQFDAYTASMMEFYMRADITRSGLQGIDGITALSDKQILQILRYLEKHPDDGHYYCDYMNACAQLGEYPYGITPDIPVLRRDCAGYKRRPFQGEREYAQLRAHLRGQRCAEAKEDLLPAQEDRSDEEFRNARGVGRRQEPVPGEGIRQRTARPPRAEVPLLGGAAARGSGSLRQTYQRCLIRFERADPGIIKGCRTAQGID